MWEVEHVEETKWGNGGWWSVRCDGELVAAFFGPLGKLRADDYYAWMQRDDLEREGGE